MIKEKISLWRGIVGVIIMFLGFILMVGSGEPMPGDPNILEPSVKSVLTGLFIIVIGILLFGVKRFILLIKKNNQKIKS